MRPPRELTREDATMTLQGLELWPSAQISLQPTGAAGGGGGGGPAAAAVAAGTSRSRSKSPPAPVGGGQYLGGRPKPSELLASSMKSREREQSKHALKGATAHTRYNVKGSGANQAQAQAHSSASAGVSSASASSGASASDVQELVSMGFGETAVRAALQRAGGRKERAVEILLGGS